MSAAAPAASRIGERPGATLVRIVRRNTWTVGLYVLLACLLVSARILRPTYGSADLQSLAIAVLPVIFAAAAQTVAVVSGGIDLSVGALMALTNVTAATVMVGRDPEWAAVAIVVVLAVGVASGALNGLLIVATRVPDIVATLAMSFVWAGAALLVLSSPGGGAADWFKSLANGFLVSEWLPRALVLMLLTVGLVWIPLRRSRLGLSIFAVGSDQLAALRSGVNVGRTKILAYAITGLFAACGGLALTMITGNGSPVPGPYTLNGVAAIVLGGVSLAGGRGGMLGPIAAAFILALVRSDLVFMGVNPNYSTVIQGVIIVIVVMVGGLITMRRRTA